MVNRKAREFAKRHADATAWEAVRATPRDLAADVCLPGIGLRRVQLIVAPSFEPGHSWDVRLLGDAARLFRSDVISDLYDEPPRLVGYAELEADAHELRSFVGRLGSLSLPIAPPADDEVDPIG